MKQYVLAIACLALIGCKGGSGGGGGSSSSPVVVNYGVYQMCENYAPDDVSVKRSLIVHESGITVSSVFHDHLNCGTGNESWSMRYLYSSTGSGNAYRLMVEGVTASSLNASDLTYNNSSSFCGYNNWVLNVPKSIMGRNCEGDTINQGDTTDVTISRSGSYLDITADSETTRYTYVGGWNFSAQGQTIQNGNYTYYDGDLGIFFTASNGSYSIKYFDKSTMRYFTESGTYTSSNNVATFIATNYTPDCGDDEGQADSYPISTTSFTLSLKPPEVSLMMEKVPYTSTQFEAAYLGSGFTAGCF